MTARIGIRDLRNRTSEMIDLVQREGEVVITNHGDPVAVLRPHADSWRIQAQRLLDSVNAPTDSGLAALLAADDEASMDEERHDEARQDDA